LKFILRFFSFMLGSFILLYPMSFCTAGELTQNVKYEYEGKVPVRGIVEGYYGKPWTPDERMDMIDFCHRVGFNAYIYAPKDDAYHRSKWREDYPPEKFDELRNLITHASEQGVRFVFCLSPGLDLHYHGIAAMADKDKIIKKFEQFYRLGVRDFAIFFDDIPAEQKDGRAQAMLLNRIEQEMRRRHKDLGFFLTVPTEYYRTDMMDTEGWQTTYTKEFSSHLNADILVLYTGEGVAQGGLTSSEVRRADRLWGRKLGLWWNYPVSDYLEGKLALGPIERLPVELFPAIFFNPMKYEDLSKLSLETGAALAIDAADYDPEKMWKQALRSQYGPLAEDMERFAVHSRHMKTSWADIGFKDAPQLHADMEAFWQAYWQGDTTLLLSKQKQLNGELSALENSIKRLQLNLPEKTKHEAAPQLLQMQRISEADRLGIQLILDQSNGKNVSGAMIRLRDKRKKIANHEQEARISENVGEAFLDECLLCLSQNER
jgi:hyaluronoglucosaminidase